MTTLTIEDVRRERLRAEREYYISSDGFLDFVRDSGCAPDAQLEPHGRYAKSIIEWQGEEDPDAPGKMIYKYKMVLWPRGSFKSTVFDIGQVCWLIAGNPDIRILVGSETGKQARAFVEKAKEIIDSEWFRERFGVHRGPKWKEGSFVSSQRTKKHIKEPTLQAAGVGEVWTGAHWDLIIGDDIVSQENTKTPNSILNTRNWFGETLAQLDPGCKLLLIGTLHHYDDLYCSIQKSPEMSRLFDFSVHAWRNGDGSLFFPGRLTPKYIDTQRALMTPRLFACFYENRPQIEEKQLFRPEYFRVVEDWDVPRDTWTYILTDWAFIAEEHKTQRSDFTCFWVVSLDQNRTAYVRDFHVGQWKLSASIMLVCQLWNYAVQQGWNPRGIALEKSATYKEMFSSCFEFVRRETMIRPKLITIEGRSLETKMMRIEAMEPRWRNGEIYICRSVRQDYERKWRPMTEALTQWPFTEHDDIPDAISDLDKTDKDDKFYCPHPPVGWRAPQVNTRPPNMVDGGFNPDLSWDPRQLNRLEQMVGEKRRLWLGGSQSTDGSESTARAAGSSPKNNAGQQDIFRKR